MARHNGSFLGVTASVSWHPAMAACRMPIDFADEATPCFPTGLTYGTRATTVCGDVRKSARLQRRMGYTWFDFWMTRDRSNSLFLRRAARLQRKLYDTLGVCKCPWPARLHGGSTIPCMNLEAQPWISSSRIAAALVFFVPCHFPGFSGIIVNFRSLPSFRVGFFSPRYGFWRFLLSLGRVENGFCVFRPADPLPLSTGAGWDSRATHVWHRTRFLSFGADFRWFMSYSVLLLFFVLPIAPPAREPGPIWAYETTHIEAQDFVTF